MSQTAKLQSRVVSPRWKDNKSAEHQVWVLAGEVGAQCGGREFSATWTELRNWELFQKYSIYSWVFEKKAARDLSFVWTLQELNFLQLWLITWQTPVLKRAKSRRFSSPLFFTSPSRPTSSSQGLYFALEQANKSTATTENDRLVNSLQWDYDETSIGSLWFLEAIKKTAKPWAPSEACGFRWLCCICCYKQLVEKRIFTSPFFFQKGTSIINHWISLFRKWAGNKFLWFAFCNVTKGILFRPSDLGEHFS